MKFTFSFASGFRYYLTILLIICLLFSPFVIPCNLEDRFSIGPTLWVYLLAASTLLYSSILMFAKSFNTKKISYKLTVIDVLVSITAIYILFIQRIFNGDLFITEKILPYTCLVIVYFFIKNSLSTLDSSKLNSVICIFFISVLTILLALCIYGWLQCFGILPTFSPFFRITGPFTNPARFALLIMALTPFCLASIFLFPKNSTGYNKIKILSIIVLAVSLGTNMILNCRAAWVGTAVSAAIIFANKYRFTLKKTMFNLRAGGSISLALLFLMIALYCVRPSSILGRFTIWKVSGDMIKDHPAFGTGYGTFAGRYSFYQAKYFSRPSYSEEEALKAGVVRYPYNIFLQIVSEQGLIGFLGFIALVYFVVMHFVALNRIANYYQKFIAISSISSIVAIIVAGQFSYPLDVLPVYIILFVDISLIEGLYTNNVCSKSDSNYELANVSTKITGVLAVIFFSSSIMLFLSAKRKYIAFESWKAVKADATTMAQLYPILKNEIDFIDLYSKVLLRENKYKEVTLLLERSKYLVIDPDSYLNLARAYYELGLRGKTESNLKIACDMVPNRFLTKYELAKFYYKTKQTAKLSRLSKKIFSMKIKIPSPTIDTIKKKICLMLYKKQMEAQ